MPKALSVDLFAILLKVAGLHLSFQTDLIIVRRESRSGTIAPGLSL